ncbi:MAG: cytochrome c biogenesis protein CcsA, partial [Planctomycetales bacterium]|nr:cytochrome c biogenesis protein CcsA [Planctomycetales bacterium]
HLLAVGARVYISGRPPVTTLYSSAVFIGCGAVLAGLVLELVFGLGIGNALAGLSGFLTLLIAHYLSVDGDTFTVLVAVLDTQFWLSTHVVTVTLGYAATFVAGLLAVMYILASTVRPDLPAEIRKVFYQATYGIVCFAIFFSFVGTVLGGLWADDSWGRFWGWDPKENGALMIVLWNALILHARWGGLVRERGFAVLCVIGNIVTGWSWFGVNELGVGKHSYGFTEGVMMWLLIFVISQMAVSALGIIQSWLHRVPKSEVARQIAPVA